MQIDPFLFTEEAITDEVAAFVKVIKRRQSELPDLTGQPAHVIRQARKDGIGIFGSQQTSARAEQTAIPGPAGDIPARIIRPAGPVRGVYLHIHGGGWVFGEAADQDLRLVDLADRLGLATVSIDYRLAPEHPYPAGPDDCEAVAVWVVDNARTEFGTEVVVIGGESAGAHLSAVTLLRMRDKHDYRGFVAANLTYGPYDLTMTPSARNWGERTLILSTATVEWFNDQFLPTGVRSDPDISPLNAYLTGLPPALFTVGTWDPLLDDSLFMAQRWMAAGNDTELAVYPGGMHAFDYFDTAMAKQSHTKIAEFIAQLL